MNNAIIFTDVNGSIGLGRYAGPYRIATEMRKNGWQVSVIDFMMEFSNQEILDILKYKKLNGYTNWVGFSSTFLLPRDTDPFGIRTAIRENTETSSSIGLYLDEAQELINQIRNLGFKVFIGGTKLKFDLEGVRWIKGTAEDKLFDSFDFTNSVIEYTKNDLIFEGEHLPLEIARGCIFKCSFCSYDLNGKRLWDFCKSPTVIKNEMISNFDKFGTTGYMFSDDTYNDSSEKVEELLKMYKTLPFDLEFSAYARFDLMLSKPETIPMLIESGMKSVFFGIETFNHDSGKAIGKGMDPEKIKSGLIDLKKEYPELLISTGFIAGLPYDTEDSLKDTVKWLESSPVDSYSFQVLSLGKNSEFGKNKEKFGYKIDNNGQWYTDKLNYRSAFQIADSVKYKSLSSFTFYNRLRNLDYKHSQIQKLTIEDRDEIFSKTITKRKHYKNELFNSFI